MIQEQTQHFERNYSTQYSRTGIEVTLSNVDFLLQIIVVGGLLMAVESIQTLPFPYQQKVSIGDAF